MTGWADVVINSTLQALSWPDGPFNFHWDWDSLSEADRLGRAAWFTGWFVILLNIALLVLPTPAEGQVAEDVDAAGNAG